MERVVIVLRREGRASAMALRWPGDRLGQAVISLGERPQPMQSPVTRSTTQTSTHGVSIGRSTLPAGAPASDSEANLP